MLAQAIADFALWRAKVLHARSVWWKRLALKQLGLSELDFADDEDARLRRP